MPIYEYTCDQCHEVQELLQKFGEDAPEMCPKCQSKGTLKKTVTASAFHLKGGGWYKDLYSSSKKPEEKKADAKTSPSTESNATISEKDKTSTKKE